MNKLIPTTDEMQILWNTASAEAFAKLNFDNILFSNNILDNLTYIEKNKKHIEGYVVKKKHIGSSVTTKYFVREVDIEKLPIVIDRNSCMKVHDAKQVYQVVMPHSFQIFDMNPQQVYNWRELTDYTGIPTHTNSYHHTLYKLKMMYNRTSPHFYGRVVTESAFGKDKYVEGWRLLVNDCSMLSDPSIPKLFYAAVHNRQIIIVEMPKPKNDDMVKFCNMLMRLGDGTNILDNPSRATGGTEETTDTSNTGLYFLQNPPAYYVKVNKPYFEQIYPYNVYNRFYPNLYTGFLQASFPDDYNPQATALKYSQYYKDIVKSLLWYESHWHELTNRYPTVSLDKYEFKKKEQRFKDHFIDFAKCLSHYAESESEYITLLEVEFASHKAYEDELKKVDGEKTIFENWSK